MRLALHAEWCYTGVTPISPPPVPTSKQRLNLTLPKHLAITLARLSLRDDLPQATKAVQLIVRGLQLDDGDFSETFVKEVKRRSKNDRLIPAKKVLARLW